MRPHLALFALALGFSPGAARANDLAEALNFAADVMGDDIVDGYENFMDWDETEALGVLLAREVTPGAPPDSYRGQGETGTQTTAGAS